ncbi:MAG: DUF502 domain-containing protein [Desulfuromonadales bacterium]|nr:DUF502 domain-containing protein [Desulfuromonadales bacterium]
MTQMPKRWTSRLAAGLLRHLKQTLAAGLLVVIPLGITLFVLRFLFNLADGVLAPYIRLTQRLLLGREFYLPGFGLALGLLGLYLFGAAATNVAAKYLGNRWDRFLARIPIARTIYFSARQVTQIMGRKREGEAYRRAVLVEFPKVNSYTVAYVTNEHRTASGKRYYSCFIPTAPNPTSGYVLVLEEGQVYPAEMNMEEAMKVIMSLGMVVPAVLTAEVLQ